jgi:hypothetical protein
MAQKVVLNSRNGASVINCCYAASGIFVSLTMTKVVDCPNATLFDTQRTSADAKISLNVNRGWPAQLAFRVSSSRHRFSAPCEASEVVVAAKQLQVIFETLLPTLVADRPPKKIGRALSDREIPPLDERSVQSRRVLGVAQRLFESPRVTGQILRSTLMMQSFLRVLITWPYRQAGPNATDNSLVEFESVSGDQRGTFKIHSAG